MQTRSSLVVLCMAAATLTACSIKKVTFFQDAPADAGQEAADTIQETPGTGGVFGGAGGAGMGGTGGAGTGGVGTGGAGGARGAGTGGVGAGGVGAGGAGTGGADVAGTGGKGGDIGTPIPVCGDGTLDAGEECDYGSATSPVTESATCNHDCTVSKCGDGKINEAARESCDTLGGNDTASCNGAAAGRVACHLTICGDGYLNGSAGEICDDGNRIDGDGCENDCTRSAP